MNLEASPGTPITAPGLATGNFVRTLTAGMRLSPSGAYDASFGCSTISLAPKDYDRIDYREFTVNAVFLRSFKSD